MYYPNELIIVRFGKGELHVLPPLPRNGVISVIWLSAKKALFEYLIKQAPSTALPSAYLGKQPSMFVYATAKQSWQLLAVMVSAHCATP